MTKRKARELGDERQVDRVRSEFSKEAAGRQDQLGDGAFQPGGGGGVLHQAPNALSWGVPGGGVGGQPEGNDARVGGEPALGHPGRGGGGAVAGQEERARGGGPRPV